MKFEKLEIPKMFQKQILPVNMNCTNTRCNKF